VPQLARRHPLRALGGLAFEDMHDLADPLDAALCILRLAVPNGPVQTFDLGLPTCSVWLRNVSGLFPASIGSRCCSTSAATRNGISADNRACSWVSSGVDRQCDGQLMPVTPQPQLCCVCSGRPPARRNGRGRDRRYSWSSGARLPPAGLRLGYSDLGGGFHIPVGSGVISNVISRHWVAVERRRQPFRDRAQRRSDPVCRRGI
jgi:hypothetical protein